MKYKIKTKIFLFSLAFLFSISLGLSAIATSLSLNILPAKVFVTEEKGETTESVISITNPNDFAIKVSVEVENFIPGVIPGDIEFIAPIKGKESLANWIEITKSFSVEFKSKKDITFQIKVPKDTSSGGHYAVIFFNAVPKAGGIGGALQIGSRVGSLVMLTVPGEISQESRISKFSTPRLINYGPVDFEILVENGGTSHFKTEGTILVKNLFGKGVAAVAVEQRIVLPKGSQILKAEWPVNFIFGFYRADLSIFAGTGEPLVASTSFFAFPWQQTLIILVVLALIHILTNYFKKKFKK